MEKIKVMLVDDDIDWQGAMGRFLSREDDIVLVGIAGSRKEGVSIAKTIPLDIVLLDINLTDNRLDGIETALEINKLSNAKIIILTSIRGEDIVIDSFTAGAVYFLNKEDYKILPKVIRMIHKKANPYEVLLREYKNLKKEEQTRVLSPCEKEVYLLMENGVSRYGMQEKLNKSENTIKKYIRQILRKLDVKTSREAVQKVNKKGLTEKKI